MNAHLSAGIGSHGGIGSRIITGKPQQASLTIKGNRPASANIKNKDSKSHERQQQAHHATSDEM